MVKHIVCWKLQDHAEGAPRTENARRIKAVLEALRGRIPGMKHIEVGINFDPSEAAYDVALYAEFDDEAALATYQIHPAHVAAKELIQKVRTHRVVVDYRLE